MTKNDGRSRRSVTKKYVKLPYLEKETASARVYVGPGRDDVTWDESGLGFLGISQNDFKYVKDPALKSYLEGASGLSEDVDAMFQTFTEGAPFSKMRVRHEDDVLPTYLRQDPTYLSYLARDWEQFSETNPVIGLESHTKKKNVIPSTNPKEVHSDIKNLFGGLPPTFNDSKQGVNEINPRLLDLKTAAGLVQGYLNESEKERNEESVNTEERFNALASMQNRLYEQQSQQASQFQSLQETLLHNQLLEEQAQARQSSQIQTLQKGILQNQVLDRALKEALLENQNQQSIQSEEQQNRLFNHLALLGHNNRISSDQIAEHLEKEREIYHHTLENAVAQAREDIKNSTQDIVESYADRNDSYIRNSQNALLQNQRHLLSNQEHKAKEVTKLIQNAALNQDHTLGKLATEFDAALNHIENENKAQREQIVDGLERLKTAVGTESSTSNVGNFLQSGTADPSNPVQDNTQDDLQGPNDNTHSGILSTMPATIENSAKEEDFKQMKDENVKKAIQNANLIQSISRNANVIDWYFKNLEEYRYLDRRWYNFLHWLGERDGGLALGENENLSITVQTGVVTHTLTGQESETNIYHFSKMMSDRTKRLLDNVWSYPGRLESFSTYQNSFEGGDDDENHRYPILKFLVSRYNNSLSLNSVDPNNDYVRFRHSTEQSDIYTLQLMEKENRISFLTTALNMWQNQESTAEFIVGMYTNISLMVDRYKTFQNNLIRWFSLIKEILSVTSLEFVVKKLLMHFKSTSVGSVSTESIITDILKGTVGNMDWYQAFVQTWYATGTIPPNTQKLIFVKGVSDLDGNKLYDILHTISELTPLVSITFYCNVVFAFLSSTYDTDTLTEAIHLSGNMYREYSINMYSQKLASEDKPSFVELDAYENLLSSILGTFFRANSTRRYFDVEGTFANHFRVKKGDVIILSEEKNEKESKSRKMTNQRATKTDRKVKEYQKTAFTGIIPDKQDPKSDDKGTTHFLKSKLQRGILPEAKMEEDIADETEVKKEQNAEVTIFKRSAAAIANAPTADDVYVNTTLDLLKKQIECNTSNVLASRIDVKNEPHGGGPLPNYQSILVSSEDTERVVSGANITVPAFCMGGIDLGMSKGEKIKLKVEDNPAHANRSIGKEEKKGLATNLRERASRERITHRKEVRDAILSGRRLLDSSEEDDTQITASYLATDSNAIDNLQENVISDLERGTKNTKKKTVSTYIFDPNSMNVKVEEIPLWFDQESSAIYDVFERVVSEPTIRPERKESIDQVLHSLKNNPSNEKQEYDDVEFNDAATVDYHNNDDQTWPDEDRKFGDDTATVNYENFVGEQTALNREYDSDPRLGANIKRETLKEILKVNPAIVIDD